MRPDADMSPARAATGRVMNRPLGSCALGASLLAACSMMFPLQSVWNHRAAYGLVADTADVAVPLACPDGADRFSVTFAARCTAGSLAARLVAPDGSVGWRQSLHTGRCDEQIALPAVAGDWRCELDLRAFSGDYCIELHAFADDCVRVEIVPAGK